MAMDLMVDGDQFAIIDGWPRAQSQPVVQFEVHLLVEPDRPATLHIFDVRAEYGVHVAVFEGQTLEAVVRSADARASMRRGVAHMKRDAAANFLEVDAQTTALLGWSAHDLLGRSTVGLVHPDDAEEAIASWMEMRAQGRSRLRVRLRHADGHYVWLEVTNENHLDDPAHGCVLTDMIDISREMAHLEALHDRERQLARLAEALPIGICHLRPDREVVFTNAPLVQLLGPVDGIDALFDRIAPSDRPAIEAALDGVGGHHEVGVITDNGDRRCELTVEAMTNDDGTIDGIIVCAADVTDRSKLREELEHRANHDALTGCLNRAATAAAGEQLLLESGRVAVAFIDLDDFKAINDEIGHAAGDELLRVTASRLRNVTRDGDMLGRQGGDEFVVVCARGESLDPDELASDSPPRSMERWCSRDGGWIFGRASARRSRPMVSWVPRDCSSAPMPRCMRPSAGHAPSTRWSRASRCARARSCRRRRVPGRARRR